MEVQLVSEDKHRAQDSEELASGGEDGTSQGTEFGNGDKDEHLNRRRRSQRDTAPTLHPHYTPLPVPEHWHSQMLGGPRTPLDASGQRKWREELPLYTT